MLLPDKRIHAQGFIINGLELTDKVKCGGTSAGYCSYGYDLRLDDEYGEMIAPNVFQIFMQILLLRFNLYKLLKLSKSIIASLTGSIDIENIPKHIWRKFKTDTYAVMPNSYVLAKTIEKVRLPNGVTGFVVDKSTLARLGLTLQNTVINSGQGGDIGSIITLEIANHGNRPVILTKGMGICSVLFITGDFCENVYEGRYKFQGEEVTIPTSAK